MTQSAQEQESSLNAQAMLVIDNGVACVYLLVELDSVCCCQQKCLVWIGMFKDPYCMPKTVKQH